MAMIPPKNPSRLLSGVLTGALVTGALAFAAPVANAAPAKPGAKVLMLNDPAYVDTTELVNVATDDGHEAANMMFVMQSQGHAVTPLLGTDASTIAKALAGKDAFVIPEQEVDSWVPDLNDAARAVVVNWVRAGGTLVTALDQNSTLNDLFGYSVEHRSEDPWLNTAPVGSPFRGGPASLPYNDGSTGFHVDSLPANAVSQYTNEPAQSSGVFTVPEGKGIVVSLGWDWYWAAPAQADGQDGGWNAVLDTSVRTGIKAVVPPVVVAPSNAFKLPAKGKVNRKNATVRLSLRLPGAGRIKVVSAKKGVLKTVSKRVGAKGSTTIELKPSKKTLKKLKKQLRNKRNASSKVRVKVTYTPNGGKARTLARTYVLKLKKK